MSILAEILEVKKEEVKALRRRYSHASFNDFDLFHQPRQSFDAALRRDERMAIITEVKKASPSAGLIRPDFDALEIAETYALFGADAISVLTDERFFQGHIRFLDQIARQKKKPLLRKDFIIDAYQVLEARAHGADAVLLICEALSALQISDLSAAAAENGLDVLLELHDPGQIEKIDFRRNRIIGINNRNLETFETRLETTLQVARQIPTGCLLVSESGITGPEALTILKNMRRVNAVLVGEHLMRARETGPALAELKKWCFYES